MWTYGGASGSTTIQYSKDDGVWRSKRVPQRFTTPEKLLCMASNRQVPKDLSKDVYSNDYMVKIALPDDSAFQKQDEISYRPAEGMDILRILIDEGIKVQIYKKNELANNKENATPIFSSHNKLGENIHELVAKELSSQVDYVVVLIYSDEEDAEGFSTSQCTEAQMQIRIASTRDNAEGCVTGSLNSLTEGLPTSVTLDPGNYGPKSGKDLQMVSDFRRASRRQAHGAPIYTVELTSDDQDLEIVVDHSDILYGVNIILIDKQAEEINDRADLRKVLGDDQGILKPHMTVNTKHQTKWVYNGLDKGKYIVRAIQPQKSSSCLNMIEARFRATDSMESILNDYYRLGNGSGDRFMSKQEEWNGVYRLPSSLPIDLNSFRFLGGGSTETRYLLFSDFFELNDDESKNKISLNIKSDDTVVRIYSEDSSIHLTQKCYDENDNLKGEHTVYSNLLSSVLDAGKCDFIFQHYTKEAQNRRVYLNEKTQLTIMVADS